LSSPCRRTIRHCSCHPGRSPAPKRPPGGVTTAGGLFNAIGVETAAIAPQSPCSGETDKEESHRGHLSKASRALVADIRERYHVSDSGLVLVMEAAALRDRIADAEKAVVRYGFMTTLRGGGTRCTRPPAWRRTLAHCCDTCSPPPDAARHDGIVGHALRLKPLSMVPRELRRQAAELANASPEALATVPERFKAGLSWHETWYRNWYRSQRTSAHLEGLKRGRNPASVLRWTFRNRPSKPAKPV
jgi:hypothetical protein